MSSEQFFVVLSFRIYLNISALITFNGNEFHVINLYYMHLPFFQNESLRHFFLIY